MSESALPAMGRRLGRDTRISWSRLVGVTGLAAAVAAGLTSLLYLGASAARLVNETVGLPSLMGMGPLTLATVSVTAAAATVAAGCVLGFLALTTRRPVRNFRVLATALAVISLSMPAAIAGPPVPMRLTMAAMHLMVWAVAIGLLPAAATPDRRRVST